MAAWLRTAPWLSRDVQSQFQDSLEAFSASVKGYSKGATCPFDASGAPEFPVGYWYLAPEQHVFEALIFNAIFVPLVWWLLQRPLAVEVPALPEDASAARHAPARARAHHWALVAADGACTATLWLTGLLTIYFKLRDDCMGRPRLAYLVQPCHLSNFILCALTFMRATPRAAWLFEFYLVTAFGALCALATPDTRGLDLLPFGCEGLLDARAWEGHTWEKVSFFVQHVLLVVLPALWIARRRFALAPPPTVDGYSCLTMWALLSVVHWDVFAPLSYLTGHNVNYMLVPPGGPLFLFGRYYRLVMLLACLPFAFIMRLLFDLVVRVSGIREEVALEGKGGKQQQQQQQQQRGVEIGGAGAMPVRARSQSPAAAAGKATTSAKKRRDTGLQGSYWTQVSPRAR